jgi:hypothetical protein
MIGSLPPVISQIGNIADFRRDGLIAETNAL